MSSVDRSQGLKGLYGSSSEIDTRFRVAKLRVYRIIIQTPQISFHHCLPARGYLLSLDNRCLSGTVLGTIEFLCHEVVDVTYVYEQADRSQ